MQQLM
jgi:hypothetical protein